MPGLTVPMKPLCDATFVAQGKKLPVNWSQPTGAAGDQYVQAFAENERNVPPEPGCYFTPASTNKYHVDQCKDVGGKMKTFCHAMLDGFQKALDMWRLQAKFKDLKIAACSAIGAPGCLDGPELESHIKNFSIPAAQGNEQKWRDAVAKGLSQCFADWQKGVSVPGLPWYPAYVAFPLAQTPPMPNVPMPLASCPSPGLAKMQPPALKQAMKDAFSLDDPDDQFGAAAQSIGTAVSSAFMAWLPMQQVMLVMGKGPVPTFAPPIVPLGPVVMGDNIAVPGHLMA
jgi:hypothetical protein